MTPEEHYAAAESLLYNSEQEAHDFAVLLVAQAQVHATLATVQQIEYLTAEFVSDGKP